MFWDVSAIRRYSMRAYAMDATEEWCKQDT
jgi:hypothetical protein